MESKESFPWKIFYFARLVFVTTNIVLACQLYTWLLVLQYQSNYLDLAVWYWDEFHNPLRIGRRQCYLANCYFHFSLLCLHGLKLREATKYSGILGYFPVGEILIGFYIKFHWHVLSQGTHNRVIESFADRVKSRLNNLLIWLTCCEPVTFKCWMHFPYIWLKFIKIFGKSGNQWIWVWFSPFFFLLRIQKFALKLTC